MGDEHIYDLGYQYLGLHVLATSDLFNFYTLSIYLNM